MEKEIDQDNYEKSDYSLLCDAILDPVIKYQGGVSYRPGTIKTICGAVEGYSCGKEIRVVDGEGIEGVSHGICSECRAKLEASSENSNYQPNR